MNWKIERKADIAKGADAARKPQSIYPLAYPGDESAHEWVVTVTDNGSSVDLSGATVTGYFYRHVDGKTPFQVGTVSDNVVSVSIPSEAYALGGYVTAIMRVAKDDVQMTLDSIVFAVGPNVTEQIIDPGEVIPSIDDLITQIERMEAATEAAEDAVSEIDEKFASVNKVDITADSNTLVFSITEGI